MIFGRFLWVYLQLEELCEAPSELIREVLRDLPVGLVETYRRILLKLQKSAWKTKIAAKAFKWIACAQRPLHVDELKEAIEYEISDKSWRNAASIDDEQIIRSFGALVCMDIEDRTIRFVHHTVLQFLFSTEEISPTFHFSQAQAHCFVGEMCVVYLSFSDFETSLTHRPPERKVQGTAIFQAGAMSTIPNVLGVGRSLFRVAYRLYGGKQATTGPTIDHHKLLSTLHKPVEAIEPVSSMLARKYRLLDYVVTYWDYHTKWLEEKNMAIWRLFRNLAMSKSLPFEFRKWGLNEHYGSYGCTTCEPGRSDSASEELPFTTLIHYAAQIGHVPLLEAFRDRAWLGLEGYLNHESPSGILLIACLNDQLNVVEHIFRNYARYVDGKMYREALKAAVLMRHENALRTLLLYVSHFGYCLSDALPTAIHQGNTSCAEQLFVAGAEFDIEIFEHGKAFHAAIKGRHDSIIAMLVYRNQVSVADVCDIDLEGRSEAGSRGIFFAASRGLPLTLEAMLLAGAAINKCDVLGKTALHYAAEGGHSRGIRLLLEHGSDVNAYASRGYVDSDGLTTLHIAAMHGHTDAVQILCEHGSDVNAYTNCRDVNSNGLTALHLAAIHGHTDAVHILCERGARVNKKSRVYASTPLHQASSHGHPDTIRKLLEHGAYLNHEDHAGRTALDHAIEYNKRDAETCLRELGALQVWTRTSRGAFS